MNGYWFLLLCATQASIAGAMGYRLWVIGYRGGITDSRKYGVRYWEGRAPGEGARPL